MQTLSWEENLWAQEEQNSGWGVELCLFSLVHFYQGDGTLHFCYMEATSARQNLLSDYCSTLPPSPSSSKDGACARGVEDLEPLTPQVLSGYTNTARVHFYEQESSDLENVTVQDLRTQWDWFTVRIYIQRLGRFFLFQEIGAENH